LSNNNTNSDEKEFEETSGTQKNQKKDPLSEYSEKEPMTPAKIKEHEPTAVSRDPNDQTIVSGGQTGTDSPEALEEYRKKGMTKVGDGNNTTTTISESSVGQQQYQTGEQQEQQYQEKIVEEEVSEAAIEEEVSEAADTVKEDAESTFDKIKAGAKALGKKVTDPDTSIEEEYNKEKSE
jgi:hypothetical protein